MQDFHYISDDTPTPPVEPAPRPAPAEPRRESSAGYSLSKLIWVLTVLCVLLGMRFFVPYFVGEIQYAITRGKQRAQYELATVGLKDQPLAGLSAAFEMVADRIGPSVVHINTTSGEAAPDDEFAFLLGPRHRQATGQGSGVVMDEQGYIVTNYHVIRDSNNIQVTLSDGRQVSAKVVGLDELTDIAVLKITANDLIPAEWGDSDDVEVGSIVWAAGSPFGLDRTITFGILSAKHRAGKAGTAYQDFLQTDAAVNPGNSGGPLLNSNGQVIGINTAIVGQTYQGISFAVPSSVARDVYERLRDKGAVPRGWLGVALGDVSEQAAKDFGLAEAKGALVVEVVDLPGMVSPAKRAGLKEGDIVIGWNDRPIDHPTALSQNVARTAIGSNAQIHIVRQGEQVTLEVHVGERPARLR